MCIYIYFDKNHSVVMYLLLYPPGTVDLDINQLTWFSIRCAISD